MIKFNWKSKTAIYIGRFQPFHKGHLEIFKKAIKRNAQVAILVMDSQGVGAKNPFSFTYVKKKINKDLISYKGKYKIIKIPVVSEVVYGRKVGYKLSKYKLPLKTEKISATKIRKKIKR